MHESYILVTAEKACSNVIVVRKYYYTQVLTKEHVDSSTHSHTKECIIENYDSYMQQHNIAILEDNDKLPDFYWIYQNYIRIYIIVTGLAVSSAYITY